MRLHILLIPLLSSIQTYAWGSVGHVVAAAIAHQFLTDEAHSKIDKVLARDPYIRAFKSIKATRPKITTVAIWADLHAITPKGRKTSDLHFVDLQARESRFSDEGMQSILSRDNIVQAIVHYDNLLRDPATTQDEQLRSLKFLIHFIADVTQPFHVRAKGQDNGNNRYFLWKDSQISLHEVWDNNIIEEAVVCRFKDSNKHTFLPGPPRNHYAAIDWANTLANSIQKLPKDRYKSRINALINCPSPESIETCAYRWALDTATLYSPSRDFPPDEDLSKKYFWDNIDIAIEQLTKAGVRLAVRLNMIYSGKTGFDWLDPK